MSTGTTPVFAVPKERSRGPRNEEMTYGFHACMALWRERRGDIIRVFLEESLIHPFSKLLKWCAENKKVYRILSHEEMGKVTKSVHHEGICIVSVPQPPVSFDEVVKDLEDRGPFTCLVYLDGVQNPHNIGSIMRVCAHFGVPYLLGDASKLPKLAPSTSRIAKGGAERVRLVPLDRPREHLETLRQMGFHMVASSSHKGTSLYDYAFPARSLIVLGSESTGIHPQLLAQAQATVLIPGTGEVESLNVAVASALFMGEYWRQRQE